ncbi:MAG TPA: iron ABC transporter substrate-binding protein [Solirubrobacteraceae bacterium]|nr:iron ABC transporter substrate-binding protein [Solirubrobacteraceae bacterium]
MRTRRSAALRATPVALVVLATGVLAACGSGGDSDELTMYSGRIAPILSPAVKQYEASSGEKVKVRYGDSPSLAAQLAEEGKNSPADIFFAQDAGSLDSVEKQGLLSPLPADILALVPKRFQSVAGKWVGVTGRSRIIAYGPKVKQSELPDSPLRLADEKWRGRVGWAPTNASLQGYITALRLVEGEDVAKKWLAGMVANDVQAYDSNIPVRDAIAKGEIDVGLINHYYVAEAQAEDPNYPVKVHFPPKDLGSLINVAGIGVLASSEHKAEAIAFVRAMLAAKAQRYFADSSKEYPLIEGVEPSKELTPLSDIPSPKVDLAKLGDLQGTLKLMRDTGAL